jgi:hypothetical protein
MQEVRRENLSKSCCGDILVGGLLYAVVLNVRADQSIENCQDVSAVFHHTREDIAQFRLAFRLAVPFGQNHRRHFNISTELFRGMAAQEQTVEKRGFSLWEVEVVHDF